MSTNQGFLSQLLDAAKSAGTDVAGVAKSIPAMIPGVSDLLIAKDEISALRAGRPTPGRQQYLSEKAAGYSPLYRALAPVASSVGLNVPGMEDSAQKGSIGGVAGHLVAPLAALGVSEALGHALPGEHPTIASEALSEHANTGGSTYEPTTGKNLSGSRKIAVSVAPEHAAISDQPFTPQQYSDFVGTHRDLLSRNPSVAVGTQVDPTTGLHRMELVGTTSSKTAANALASHLGEDHAYNLATDEKIPTGADPNADRPVSHMSVDERIQQLNAASPQKQPYNGTHFSDAKLDMIDGARRGAPNAKGAAVGSEAERLRLGSKTGMGEDAPAGFYTYKAGALPDASVASRKNTYQVRGSMAFASTDHPEFQNGYVSGVQKAIEAGADPKTAHQLGLNAAERAIQDAGYDGYHSPAHPNVRFHFGGAEATPVAPRQVPQLDLTAPYGPPKADFKGSVPPENQGFDFSPAKDYGNSARADVERRMGGPLPRGTAERRVPAVTPNGSGESVASLEAVHRAAAEKKNGVQRLRIDTRSGNATPVIGPDAVDATAGPFDVIVQRTPQGDVELSRGLHARRMK